MRDPNRPIRVLVVEDSPTARDLLLAILGSDPKIQVVGTALDGEEAVLRAQRLRPDVITMDIHMPKLDGLAATRRIMHLAPTRIVIVTANTARQDIDLSFEAMRSGALTVIEKPSLTNPESFERVLQSVRLMADVQVVHRWKSTGILKPSLIAETLGGSSGAIRPGPITSGLQRRKIIGIASSTGGPAALSMVLKNLDANYPMPILIVQHITRGFAGGLAEWLATQTPLRVLVGEHGQQVQAGTVYLAPDDQHMQINDHACLEMIKDPPYKGLRPSANYTLSSLAAIYGPQSVGVILTGMGDDGVDGMENIHKAGGLTIAQDEQTCVVFGMPREAIERRAVDYVMPIERIGTALQQLAVPAAGR